MLAERVNDKQVYEFAIKTYKKLKTSTYEEVFIPHTIYRMVQLGLDIEFGKKIIKDNKEILTDFNVLRNFVLRVDNTEILGSLLYARADMLKDLEIEEHMKTDIDKWLLLLLEGIILVSKETTEYFKGEAKNIKIKSNNLSCTSDIRINDEVEQILEINENGKVSFKSYKYNGKDKDLILAREENTTIIKGLIKEILDIVSGLFSQEYQSVDDLIKTNIGEWEVKIATEEDKYIYTGNLGRHLKHRGVNVSDKIRSIINIEHLLLFDNNIIEDRINKIEVEYKRRVKNYPEKNKDWNQSETLVIDRASKSIEYKKHANNELFITKKYKIEQIIENTLDNFDSKNMFTKIEGNPKDSIPSTEDAKTYSAIITFQSGRTREIKGSYDKRSVPDDWEDFIGDIIAIFAYFGVEDLFNDSIFNQRTRHKTDKIYLSVSLGPNMEKTYYYLTNTDDVRIGDFVVVPFGIHNEEKLARVENKEYFNENFVPFPLDRMKSILAIYEGEVGVDEDGPITDFSKLKDKKDQKQKEEKDLNKEEEEDKKD